MEAFCYLSVHMKQKICCNLHVRIKSTSLVFSRLNDQVKKSQQITVKQTLLTLIIVLQIISDVNSIVSFKIK